MREVLLIVHIAAAGAWLGANIVQIAGQRMMAATPPEARAAWYRVTGGLAGPVYIPAGVLLVISGSWMVLTVDAYSFADAFVVIGLAVIVVGAASATPSSVHARRQPPMPSRPGTTPASGTPPASWRHSGCSTPCWCFPPSR